MSAREVIPVRLPLSLLVFAFLVPSTAGAVADGDLLDCARLPADDERLRCFDGLAQQVDAASDQRASAWRVQTSPAEFVDGTNVYLTIRASEPITDAVAGTVYPEFWIQCDEGEMEAFVDWGFTIGGGRKAILARLDKEPAQQLTIEISPDYRAVGTWDSARVTGFAQNLLGKRRFLIETSTLAGTPIRASFPVAGFDEAAAPLRAACGW
jgi:hypothetical protein